MGTGASASKKYVLKAIEIAELGSTASVSPVPQNINRSRKPTAVYPVQEGNDSFDFADVKHRQLHRRGSKTGLTLPMMPEDGRSPSLSPNSKLTRMNSKFSDQTIQSSKSETASITPAVSMKGIILQTASSNKNLLSHAQISGPAPLTTQPSTRSMSRSNSISSSRITTATVCSSTYPWLLKSTNMHGQALGDFELGRVIGTCF